MKKILIGILVLVVLGVGGYLLFAGSGNDPSHKHQEHHSHNHDGHDHDEHDHHSHDHDGHEHDEHDHNVHKEDKHADAKKQEIKQGRLLVADKEGKLFVYSLAQGKVIKTFDLGAPVSSVNTTQDRKFGIVLDRNNHKTFFIDSGFDLESHGDHFDPVVFEPKKLDLKLTYPKPTHFQLGDNAAVIYYDGIGKKGNPVDSYDKKAGFIAIEDGELEFLEKLPYVELNTSAHGSAEFIDNFVIAATRHKTEGSPLADKLSLYKRDGDSYKFIKNFDIEASGLHGSATVGNRVIFAPREGVIVIDKKGDNFSERRIDYPDSVREVKCLDKHGKPKHVRFGSFAKNKNLKTLFVGNACRNLFSIDTKANKINPIKWDGANKESVVKYTFDNGGEHLIFLDKKGVVHIAEVADNFKVIHNIPVIEGGMDGNSHGGPRLFTNAQDNTLFVVNPAAKGVTQIDIESGKITKQINLSFEPKDANWLGLSGKVEFHH